MSPYAAPTRCTERECGAWAVKQGRCADHQRRAWANMSHRNRVLDTYTWARARALHIAHHPCCEVCGCTTHLEVDHIIRPRDGGALYDQRNLQTLCHDCHKAKEKHYDAMRRARESGVEEEA